ncbi:MAG: alpha/beta fold hydrolase [Terriglobales bacterium]
MKKAFIAALVTLAFLCSSGSPVGAQVNRQDSCEIADKSGIPTYEWCEPDSSPKAVAILMHGLTQEGRSVEALAQQLASDNYLVLSLDQRGHGRWHFGDKHLAVKANYTGTVDDLLRVCHTVKASYPHLQLFCVGESAGSAVVAQAAARDPSVIDGIVLCSPGTCPRVYNPVWVLSDFFCNIYRLDHPIDLRRYINKYASEDRRITDEMLSDPMCRYKMSGREILGTLRLIWHTRKAVKDLPDDMPLLVVQGGRDHILAPFTASLLVHSARSTSKKLVVLPKLGHVLMGTALIKPVVSNTITTWLDSRVQTGSAAISVAGQLANSVRPETTP